jgi:hypothetical protein
LKNRRIDELEEQVFYGNIDNIIVLDVEELKFVIRKAIQNIVRYNWIDENIHLALEYLSQLIMDIIL